MNWLLNLLTFQPFADEGARGEYGVICAAIHGWCAHLQPTDVLLGFVLYCVAMISDCCWGKSVSHSSHIAEIRAPKNEFHIFYFIWEVYHLQNIFLSWLLLQYLFFLFLFINIFESIINNWIVRSHYTVCCDSFGNGYHYWLRTSCC